MARLLLIPRAMAGNNDIRGRVFGIAVSALLVGEAYALWKPQALGALPQPDLGPFSHYRLVIALLTAGAGIVVALASLLGGDSGEETPAPKRRDGPRVLDFAPAPQMRPPEPRPEPPPAPRPEPVMTRPPPRPPMAPPDLVRQAPVPHEDTDDLDPFPGLEPARRQPLMPPLVPPPAPPPWPWRASGRPRTPAIWSPAATWPPP